MLTQTDRTAINLWLNAVFCQVFDTVVGNMNTVSYMRYERYDEPTHRERESMRFMLAEYYRVMGLTEASFGPHPARLDDLHFVELMLNSYILSFMCGEGGYEAVRLYCQRAILMIRFSRNYGRASPEEIQQLNVLEQLVMEMQPYCFKDLKSDYVMTNGSLPSANILNLIIDHFPSVLISCKPSDIWSLTIANRLLHNTEECHIAYQHPLMQEHVWYPLLMQRQYDFVSQKLHFYIKHPAKDPPYAYNDFPLVFWERFCTQYADEITALYYRTLTPAWQQVFNYYNNLKIPFLDFLMRHVWLLVGERESPFVLQLCEHLLPIVQEQLDAYFAEPTPLPPRSHLHSMVQLMEQQNFLMILDTSHHEFSWPVAHYNVATYFCKDAQHQHFLAPCSD